MGHRERVWVTTLPLFQTRKIIGGDPPFDGALVKVMPDCQRQARPFNFWHLDLVAVKDQLVKLALNSLSFFGLGRGAKVVQQGGDAISDSLIVVGRNRLFNGRHLNSE